jgi:AcrR family transcriptional regulator
MNQTINPKLGKREWVRAGLTALADGGVDAVRVERLAVAMAVTKGSFYWHFKDRGELLAALIEAWREQATDAIISQVETLGGGAGQKMRSLFSIVVLGDGRLEQAIRVWAASDDDARAALAGVDQKRMDYLASLFEQLGFTGGDAGARARLVYHALIGQYTIGTAMTPQERLNECLNIVYPMVARRT